MPADLKFYDATVTLLTTFSFDLVPPESSGLVAWLINDGDETAPDVSLKVAERDVGETEWNFAGRPIVDARRVKAAITGGYGGYDVAGQTLQLGAGMALDLGSIPAGGGVKLLISVLSPVEQEATVVELAFALRVAGAEAIDLAFEQLQSGNVFPVRNPLESGLSAFGSIAEQGSPSAFVDVADVGGLWQGVPVYVPAESFELDDEDGSAATLASGEAYIAAVYLGPSGIAAVKGEKGAAPLSPADRPALTADQAATLIAWVNRDFDAAIATVDITAAAVLRWGAVRASGANLIFAPGIFHTAGQRARRGSEQVIACADDDFFWAYRLPSGDLAATFAASVPAKPAPPVGNALEVASGTSSAGTITAFEAPRFWLPRPRVLTFVLESLVIGAAGYASIDGAQDAFIAPLPTALALQQTDAGMSLTADGFEVVIEWAPPGALPVVWTELTASGARLSIPYTSTTGYATVGPTETRIPAGSLLRARITDIPAGPLVGALIVTAELV